MSLQSQAAGNLVRCRVRRAAQPRAGWREAGSLRRPVPPENHAGEGAAPARAAALVDPSQAAALLPFEEGVVSFMLHEFDLGISWPVPPVWSAEPRLLIERTEDNDEPEVPLQLVHPHRGASKGITAARLSQIV